LESKAEAQGDQETPYLKAQHIQWLSVRTSKLLKSKRSPTSIRNLPTPLITQTVPLHILGEIIDQGVVFHTTRKITAAGPSGYRDTIIHSLGLVS